MQLMRKVRGNWFSVLVSEAAFKWHLSEPSLPQPTAINQNTYSTPVKNGTEHGSTIILDLLLLLYCCFTSTVNIKGHVGTVS